MNWCSFEQPKTWAFKWLSSILPWVWAVWKRLEIFLCFFIALPLTQLSVKLFLLPVIHPNAKQQIQETTLQLQTKMYPGLFIGHLWLPQVTSERSAESVHLLCVTFMELLMSSLYPSHVAASCNFLMTCGSS